MIWIFYIILFYYIQIILYFDGENGQISCLEIFGTLFNDVKRKYDENVHSVWEIVKIVR